MTTLPAMIDDDIDAHIVRSESYELGSSLVDQSGDMVDFRGPLREFARAIIAARDAQWQAANDTLAAEVDRLQAMLSNADCKWQAVADAAVMQEREACADAADAFLTQGRSPLGRRVADAIRARTKDTPRCALCNYEHGHAIGCDNNPVDIALRARTKEKT